MISQRENEEKLQTIIDRRSLKLIGLFHSFGSTQTFQQLKMKEQCNKMEKILN